MKVVTAIYMLLRKGREILKYIKGTLFIMQKFIGTEHTN